MPRWCPGKVRAKSERSLSRPQDREHLATCLVGSPGAQRLWTDWLPLGKKKKLPHCCHSAICCCASKRSAHQSSIFTYPLSTPSSMPRCTPPPAFLPNPPLSPLPLFLFAHCTFFADEIKQTHFHLCVWSGAPDCAAKTKNQCSPKWEIKPNVCRFGLSHSVFITPNKPIMLTCVWSVKSPCEHKSVWSEMSPKWLGNFYPLSCLWLPRPKGEGWDYWLLYALSKVEYKFCSAQSGCTIHDASYNNNKQQTSSALIICCLHSK